MKINTRDIDSFLNRDFTKFKAILLYGNNLGLVHDRIACIYKKFFQGSSEQEKSNKVKLRYSDIAKAPDLLSNEISALSFFGTKKLVVVSEVTGGIPKQLESMLLENPTPDTLVIFYGGQIAAKDQVRKFFETKEKFASVPCYLEEAPVIERKIYSRLKEAEIKIIDPEAVKYAANSMGGDTRFIAREIDKLVAICKEKGQLSINEVKDVVSKTVAETNGDKYITCLMEGKMLSAELEFEKLILAGAKPSYIIRALARYFNQLYVAYGLIDEGVSTTEVPSKLKPPIFFKAIPTFRTALKKYSASKTLEVLEQLFSLEIKAKIHDASLAKTICEKELFDLFA